MLRVWADVRSSFACPKLSPCTTPYQGSHRDVKRCNAPRHAATETEQASLERRDGSVTGLVGITTPAPISLGRHACFEILPFPIS
jgi:hypothetical protein